MRLPTLLSLPLLPSVLLAANLTLHIAPTNPLPDPSTLSSTTTSTLQSLGYRSTSPLFKSNAFHFRDIPPGDYLLTIQSREFNFPAYRVDVSAPVSWDGGKGGAQEEGIEVHGTFWGNEWGNKGELRGSAEGNLVVSTGAVGRKEYYVQRAGFSPMSFLKNPMILMALVSLVLIVGMPYLMESMDEETKAEFEEMQSNSAMSQATKAAQGGSMANFDMAGWLAGRGSGTSGSGEGKKKD